MYTLYPSEDVKPSKDLPPMGNEPDGLAESSDDDSEGDDS